MSAHAEFLRAASNDRNLATDLKKDFRKARISERDRRMLEFVEKLTLYPWVLVQTDVGLLRDAGFSDVEILHIVLGSAHFNYLNRMADGIGIRFEYQSDLPEFQKPAVQARPQPFPTSSAAPSKQTARVPNSSATAQAWIRYSDTADLRTEADEPRNLFLVMSENAEATVLSQAWRRYQLAPTPFLDTRLRAQLALFISGLNRCDYSSFWFRRILQGLGVDAALCQHLAEGHVPNEISVRDRHLFEHVERLTRAPWTTEEKHIDQLRSNGLDDAAILRLTMLASYLSFENRVALGLGIPLEGSPGD